MVGPDRKRTRLAEIEEAEPEADAADPVKSDLAGRSQDLTTIQEEEEDELVGPEAPKRRKRKV